MKKLFNGGKPHPNSKDKTGMVFGRLTALKRITPAKNHCYDWLCRCSCGKRVQLASRKLNNKNKHHQSCGCLREEMQGRPRTHGDTGSREHRSWGHIVGRCHNPKNPAYNDYGGRGIKVCKRWRSSYSMFLKDMGRCPKGLTIDRIDNDGDYKPGNCRWATTLVQNRNRRDNRIFTVKGITGCMSELSEHFGLRNATVWHRIEKAGWSVEDAFSMPIKKKGYRWYAHA